MKAQAYKVKLNKNHTAEPDQITKDGYLADDDGNPFIYNQSAAKDKAEKFGGVPEKFGKSHELTKVKMIQVDQNFVHKEVVELAREKSCYDNGGKVFICYGRIFDDLLEMGGLSAEVIEELQSLSVYCVDMDYVQFL